MLSTIKKIKNFDEILKNKLIITKIYANKETIENHKQRLSEIFKNDTEEQLMKKIHNIILRENTFNRIMDSLATYFDFELNDADISEEENRIKQMFPSFNEEQIKSIALKSIEKTLIFDFLAGEWNISVDDEEVKKSLDEYYKKTSLSIKNFLNDKKEFEKIRESMVEEKIIVKLFSLFPVEFKLEKNTGSEENKLE